MRGKLPKLIELEVISPDRRGKFKRIYPNQNAAEYRLFFVGERPYNDLLRAMYNQISIGCV